MAMPMNARTLLKAAPEAVRRRRDRHALPVGRHHWSLVALLCVFAGCERNDMHNQPRHEPMEPSSFFVDGQSSRPTVGGTIARGQLVSAEMRYAGLGPQDQPPTDAFPFEITRADLERGQQRFNIYCAVCHGADGDGDGMIVQRGFTRPPSLHEQRLKDAPVGHFFNVITNGWGAMYSYNDRIFPEDRWRIIAYVRTLQLSQAEAVAAAPPQQGSGQVGMPQGSQQSRPGGAGVGTPSVQGAVDSVLQGSRDAQQQPQNSNQQPERPPTGGQPQPGGNQ